MRTHSSLRRFSGRLISTLAQNPLHYRLIGPETVRRAPDKPQVPAMFGREQLNPRVPLHGFRAEDLEWNEGIVLRLNQQRRHAEAMQIAYGGLVPVVVGSVAEAEGWRRK